MPGGIIKQNKDRIVDSIPERNKIARFWSKSQSGVGVLVKNAYRDYPAAGQGDFTVHTPGTNAFYKWMDNHFVKISEEEALDKDLGELPIYELTYFVSPNGDDNSAKKGDPSKPFRLATAIGQAQVGDTIVFLAGYYTINFNIAKNGIAYRTMGGPVYIECNAAFNAEYLFDFQTIADSEMPISIVGDFHFILSAANSGIFRFYGVKLRTYDIRWSRAYQYFGRFIIMPSAFESATFEGTINIESDSTRPAISCPAGSSGLGVLNVSIVNKSATNAILPYFTGWKMNIAYQGYQAGLFSDPLGSEAGRNELTLSIKQGPNAITTLFRGTYQLNVEGGMVVVFNGQQVNITGSMKDCKFQGGPQSRVSAMVNANNVAIVNDQTKVMELDGTWEDCTFSLTSTYLTILQGNFYNLTILNHVGIMKIPGYVRLTDNTGLYLFANSYLEITGKVVGNNSAGVVILTQYSPNLFTGQIKNIAPGGPVIKCVGGGWSHRITLHGAILEAGPQSTNPDSDGPAGSGFALHVPQPDSAELIVLSKTFMNAPVGGTGSITYGIGTAADILVNTQVEVINY